MRGTITLTKPSDEQEVTAGKKKNKRDNLKDRSPGSLTPTLEDDIPQMFAREFGEKGEQLYQEIVGHIKDLVAESFRHGVKELGTTVRDEWGRHGYSSHIHYVRPWLNALVEDLRKFGLDDVKDSLDLIASESSVVSEDEDDLDTGILEVEPPPAEEIPDIPVEDEELEMDLSSADLPEVAEPPAMEAAEELPLPPEDEEVPVASALTVKDVRRQLAKRRKTRTVVAETPVSTLVASAQSLLADLDK